MSDPAEIHSKLMPFLMGEFARKEGKQCVGIDLLYSPGQGWKDESVRSWERSDQPDIFEDFAQIERLVTEIIEIAEGEANAKQAGKHRFVVRTRQHLNGRQLLSFYLYPQFNGADETALAVSKGSGSSGGDRPDILANHASQLMRVNTQMFDGALRALSSQQNHLLSEITELRTENLRLSRELEAAKNNNMVQEYQMAMAMEKNARVNAGFQKVLQIGSIVAAKLGGEDQSSGGQPSGLSMLVLDFGKSLTKEQIGVLMSTLDITQKGMFMEIMNMVTPRAPEGQAQQPGA